MSRLQTFWSRNRTLVYTVSGLILGYSFAIGMSYLLFSVGQEKGRGHIQSFALTQLIKDSKDEILDVIMDSRNSTSNEKTNALINQGIIAFYAISTRDIDLEHSQTIVFDHVYTNIGKGYNPKTGKFIAHFDGLYRFGSTGMSQSNDIVHLQMNKNGFEVARSTAQQNYNTADMEAILELKKGDVIEVTRRTNSNEQTERLHGNRLASFTGFLITTM
ncbi:complement C1q subcomponent subunit B-like [Mytilus californianus]|uniref:complement C1q subcomponent subunit B-like n=1 Tax=Mytilus californianus TaxID=6549 RepID=UPI00224844B6|nr:complement C1q subcomponent subunit B-like [Mytilus californianus]